MCVYVCGHGAGVLSPQGLVGDFNLLDLPKTNQKTCYTHTHTSSPNWLIAWGRSLIDYRPQEKGTIFMFCTCLYSTGDSVKGGTRKDMLSCSID